MTKTLTFKPSVLEDLKSTVGEYGYHSEQVFEWRKRDFVRMGFVDFMADFLASTRIDLHQMEDLLKKGCAHTTAAEILLGTMWSGDDPLWGQTEAEQHFARDDDEEDIAAELTAP